MDVESVGGLSRVEGGDLRPANSMLSVKRVDERTFEASTALFRPAILPSPSIRVTRVMQKNGACILDLQETSRARRT